MEHEAFVQQAYTSILSGDYEQAIRWFEQAITAQPDNAEVHYKCSITCARSGKWDKALQHAQEALRLRGSKDDGDYAFHVRMIEAKLLAAQAVSGLTGADPQLEWAKELLQRAIGLDPLYTEAYMLLGEVHAELGQYALAKQQMQDVLELDPLHETAKRKLQQYGRYAARRQKKRKR
ncbi:tetratricopeptide repeat protein [Paenibacillus sp. IB182496]|uniref:Tetratricopeptide repeat protein n=1 Tax=Paenibacillus sabuli TaxID=2772509 RepID=A0A927BSU4_9BACL|nr:tetratricopeptide repeat protein [Paenibacillus sabuli]MBD2845135.1 tetratricopeptide repeat protein [Paenibacillus sabuli]